MAYDEVQDTAAGAGAQDATLADTARLAANRVAERTRAASDQVADAAADVAERVSAQANDALGRALRYTTEHPLQALAAVLIAGFAVGRLSRRD